MAKTVVSLNIELLDDGRVTVNGPLHDRVLCYGLMGVAHDVVQDHVKQAQDTRTQVIAPASAHERQALVGQ